MKIRTAVPQLDSNGFTPMLRGLVLAWEHPGWALLLSSLIYAFITYIDNGNFSVSYTAYFNYLADAFLHGQLHLSTIPSYDHDLVLYQGKYFLYWPPMPAVLMMPFVAIWGVNFSDILFTLALGGGNVALVALLLRAATRQGVVDLCPLQRGLLVMFFSLGTVHTGLAPFGRVWYTAEIVGFFFIALAYLAAVSLGGLPAFVLTGLALAIAAATRNHLVFNGLWPALYLFYEHRKEGWGKLARYSLAGVLPLIAAAGLLAVYNEARFGSYTNVGLDYHLMAENFLAEYRRYGAFNLYYFPTNFFYQYIAYPFPLRQESLMGGSLFLLSPVFLAIFWGVKDGRPRWSVLGLVLSIILVSIPILLLMGTGWVQFGPRYTLDFSVPLLLLTAMGVRRWRLNVLALLVLISAAQYLAGVFWFAGLP